MSANDKHRATFHSPNTYGDPGADPAEAWDKPTAEELELEAEAYRTNDAYDMRNSLREALRPGTDGPTYRGVGALFRPAEDTWKDSLEGLADAIFQVQEDNGWHSKERDLPEIIALIHSELSEALEEYRNGVRLGAIYYTRKVDGETDGGDPLTGVLPADQFNGDGVPNKVEGIAAELADAIIRILDASVQKGIPTIEALFQKHEYNKTRGFRHGGKVV